MSIRAVCRYLCLKPEDIELLVDRGLIQRSGGWPIRLEQESVMKVAGLMKSIREPGAHDSLRP